MEFPNAPDGGWGWMVVLSVHFMHLLIGGLDRATGVFYTEILFDMQQSSASTTSFSALLFSSKFMSAPLAGLLCKYWGCRIVMIVGGILSCLGVMLSAFCRSLELINLTLGFITGVGNGLCYTSGLLVVNEYFNRRRATALGITTAGTGVGSFVMPLLVQQLIRVYSYRGCMIILSGLSLNLVLCGVILFPLPPTPPAKAGTPGQEDAEKGRNGNSGQEGRGGAEKVRDSEGPSGAACRRFLAQLWANFDLKLLRNPRFSVFAVAALFISAGFKPVPVLLPHHAQLNGLGETTSVLLISIAGAFDTVSRFSLGLLFDVPRLAPHRRRIWSLGMLLTAASCAAFAFMQSLAPFILVAIAFGLTSGLFVSQVYCVLGDLIGRERSRSGIGLLILLRGVGVGVGPPVAGAIKDATGTYLLSFCALGGFILIGFLCLGLLELLMLRRGRRDAEATTLPPPAAGAGLPRPRPPRTEAAPLRRKRWPGHPVQGESGGPGSPAGDRDGAGPLSGRRGKMADSPAKEAA